MSPEMLGYEDSAVIAFLRDGVGEEIVEATPNSEQKDFAHKKYSSRFQESHS